MATAVLNILLAAAMLLTFHRNSLAVQLCVKCHKSHYTDKGDCTSCHRGNPATLRRDIAHETIIKGRYLRPVNQVHDGSSSGLIEKFGCRRCHSTGGRGNALSSDLNVSVRKGGIGKIESSILRPASYMPDFRMSKGTLEAVVSELLANASSKPKTEAEQMRRIYFHNAGNPGDDVFSRKCGNCHRMLSEARGGIGRGDAAPNLSGLFSRYYPRKNDTGNDWNMQNLEEWLRNPRSVRKSSTMQPVVLNRDEIGLLSDIVRIKGSEQIP